MHRSRAHLIVWSWFENDGEQHSILRHSPVSEEQNEMVDLNGNDQNNIFQSIFQIAECREPKLATMPEIVVVHFHNMYNQLATDRKMNGTRDTGYVTQMNLLFSMWFVNVAGVWAHDNVHANLVATQTHLNFNYTHFLWHFIRMACSTF